MGRWVIVLRLPSPLSPMSSKHVGLEAFALGRSFLGMSDSVSFHVADLGFPGPRTRFKDSLNLLIADGFSHLKKTFCGHFCPHGV